MNSSPPCKTYFLLSLFSLIFLASPAYSQSRVALVVGNASYSKNFLKNPVNDAKAFARALAETGFDVTLKTDTTKKEFTQAINAFGRKLQKGGTGLFYYAGHGIQVHGRNYLLPIDMKIESESDVEYEAVDAGRILGKMQDAGNRLNIVILDACRDNPFVRGFGSAGSRGLAQMDAPTGSFIAYATRPGAEASDGDENHSPYTAALLKHIKEPELSIEHFFKKVRKDVITRTQGKQVPWDSSSLVGDFYFSGTVSKTAITSTRKVPNQPAATPSTPQPALQSTSTTWHDSTTGMEFIFIKGGCFQMGSAASNLERQEDEGPIHEVCVDDFYMGKFEVTNEQFRKYLPTHSSGEYEGISLNGDNQPAVLISWTDARNYARWLSEQSGKQYRLPTEAEWEYAAKAGKNVSRFWDNSEDSACSHASVADQSAKNLWRSWKTHDCNDGYPATAPVGSFPPNRFGLHDMLGNVWEWCSDWYDQNYYTNSPRKNPAGPERGIYRAGRGGGWVGNPSFLRIEDRSFDTPDKKYNDLGFRLTLQTITAKP